MDDLALLNALAKHASTMRHKEHPGSPVLHEIFGEKFLYRFLRTLPDPPFVTDGYSYMTPSSRHLVNTRTHSGQKFSTDIPPEQWAAIIGGIFQEIVEHTEAEEFENLIQSAGNDLYSPVYSQVAIDVTRITKFVVLLSHRQVFVSFKDGSTWTNFTA